MTNSACIAANLSAICTGNVLMKSSIQYLIYLTSFCL